LHSTGTVISVIRNNSRNKKLTDLNKKKTIRKILILGAWLLVISGITTLLIAANRKEQVHVCKEIFIGIKGNEGKFYVEKEDVLKLLQKTENGSLLQKQVNSINLARLENGLKTNPWIRRAELYFDSKDALHVFVEEREPVARIFTTTGSSFYMDSSGARMPLLEKMSIRVPVITGFTSARRFNYADSALLQQAKQVAQFIYGSQFWNAQVGQIDITPDGKFELIPVIGGHIIKLGTGENVEEKLNNLYVFYKQVMSKVGFDKYAAVGVEFKGQVVAIKKEPASPVDSIQLKKNIEELVNRANMQNVEEDMLPNQNLVIKTDSVVSTAAAQNIPAATGSVSTKTNPNPTTFNPLAGTNQTTAQKKTQTKSIPKKQPVPIVKPKQNVKSQVKANKVKPKAVMPSVH